MVWVLAVWISRATLPAVPGTLTVVGAGLALVALTAANSARAKRRGRAELVALVDERIEEFRVERLVDRWALQDTVGGRGAPAWRTERAPAGRSAGSTQTDRPAASGTDDARGTLGRRQVQPMRPAAAR